MDECTKKSWKEQIKLIAFAVKINNKPTNKLCAFLLTHPVAVVMQAVKMSGWIASVPYFEDYSHLRPTWLESLYPIMKEQGLGKTTNDFMREGVAASAHLFEYEIHISARPYHNPPTEAKKYGFVGIIGVERIFAKSVKERRVALRRGMENSAPLYGDGGATKVFNINVHSIIPLSTESHYVTNMWVSSTTNNVC